MLAFSLSLGVAIGRSRAAPILARAISFGIVILSAGAAGIGYFLAGWIGRVLASAIGRSRAASAIISAIAIASSLGIAIASGINPTSASAIGLATGVAVVIAIAIGSGGRISIHPLKALALSLVFIILVGLIANLIKPDAISPLWNAISEDIENYNYPKVLAFVALNIFADVFSLLETRWVLQRGNNATVVQLLGLLVLDLVASAAIFLFLPAVLCQVTPITLLTRGDPSQITTFWDAAFFGGQIPWLGILFWSTFGTSVVFYLFVTAVFLFLLPGHALSNGFRKLIGSFSSIEDHPFSSIAYALSTLFILLALASGITALISWIF